MIGEIHAKALEYYIIGHVGPQKGQSQATQGHYSECCRVYAEARKTIRLQKDSLKDLPPYEFEEIMGNVASF